MPLPPAPVRRNVRLALGCLLGRLLLGLLCGLGRCDGLCAGLCLCLRNGVRALLKRSLGGSRILEGR